ncbi:MAG: dockerin type I repeat-containing protein [Acutalibacteraceae bacterium]
MKMMYKIVSFVLGTVFLLTCFSTVAFAEGEQNEIILGDLNSNGKVDINDARLILRIAASMEMLTDEYLLNGDMNADGVITVEDAVIALRQAVNIGGVTIPDKNGENYLSDDPNNEFIQLIANTYGVDPASLVAIYSVPDSGTNYVLRFKKSLIGNNYEKSVDNLEYVYHIGKAPERTVSYTNGKLVLGEHYNCEPAEGVMVFNLVQTVVMEQYPDYFEGTGQK